MHNYSKEIIKLNLIVQNGEKTYLHLFTDNIFKLRSQRLGVNEVIYSMNDRKIHNFDFEIAMLLGS